MDSSCFSQCVFERDFDGFWVEQRIVHRRKRQLFFYDGVFREKRRVKRNKRPTVPVVHQKKCVRRKVSMVLKQLWWPRLMVKQWQKKEHQYFYMNVYFHLCRKVESIVNSVQTNSFLTWTFKYSVYSLSLSVGRGGGTSTVAIDRNLVLKEKHVN